MPRSDEYRRRSSSGRSPAKCLLLNCPLDGKSTSGRDHAYGPRQRLLWLGPPQPEPPLRARCEHERPWQPLRHAVVESFFHSLKVESVHGAPLMHPDALRQAHFETIEGDTTEPVAIPPLDTSALRRLRHGSWRNRVSTVTGQEQELTP